ncbi:hypothetical protein PXQ59_002164 [Vibrio parahaemolyticus]|nr:hypothetical protein [Vibrio parahaemolyticus]
MAFKEDLDLSGLGLDFDFGVEDTPKVEEQAEQVALAANKHFGERATVMLPKSLIEEIMKSKLHDKPILFTALPELIKLGIESDALAGKDGNKESLFRPTKLVKEEGKNEQVSFITPKGLETFFEDKIKSQVLPAKKSLFIVELVKWVLAGYPEMTENEELMSDEEKLIEVLDKTISILCHKHNIKAKHVMEKIGLKTSDHSRLRNKKLVGLITMAKKINKSDFKVNIDFKNETVAMDGNVPKSFDKFLKWKAFS